MAETNTSGSGDAAINTTTSTTGTGGGRGTAGGGNTTSNTTTATSGAGGSTVSSANTQDAKLDTAQSPQENEAAPAALDIASLPYPHQALTNVSEGTVYRNLVDEVFKEHETELAKESGTTYEPVPEMVAARADAQERLASELRASLKAQRTMAKASPEQGTIKVKINQTVSVAGVSYQKGDEITVTERVANFIEEAKAGKRV